jgi:mycothiol synthase
MTANIREAMPHTTADIDIPAEFTMRPATPADIPALVDLFNASEKIVTGYPMTTAKNFERSWTAPNFDVANSTRVLIEKGTERVAGYISVWDTEPLPVSNWVAGRVHPDYEGRGLGTALHRWAAFRLQQAVARVPDDLKVEYHTGALKQHTAAHPLFESLGMEKVRYFWRMIIELDGDKVIPEPVLPEGVVIRPWSEVNDEISLRDIAAADQEAFRDHWGYVDQPLDELLADWQHWLDKTPEMGPDCWFLALDEQNKNEIAGFSLCIRKSRNNLKWGYLDGLGVRRAYRKQGIGLALLHHTFRYFQALDFERVELHVDASSLTGATRLYEKAGMHVDEESIGYVQVIRHGRDISTKTLND